MVSALYAVGNILLGHFEEQTPKFKRIGKYLLTLLIIVGLSIYFGRIVAMVVLGLTILPAVYLHAIVLPRKGINGWTGEPKQKYYELRGWDKDKMCSGS
ncbi:MAG: hypothetical protein WBA23_23000 [Tunicatimonas sp.]|uniref:hypothetical protein n=1 Tax=Tunicatimonas sp. TaxID=1940096 RepID=UPI003C755847